MNHSLTAAGMFWNISDHVNRSSKGAPKESSEETKGGEEFDVEALWTLLIDRVKEIAKNSRLELRRHTYLTLENFLANHGENISMSIKLLSLHRSRNMEQYLEECDSDVAQCRSNKLLGGARRIRCREGSRKGLGRECAANSNI